MATGQQHVVASDGTAEMSDVSLAPVAEDLREAPNVTQVGATEEIVSIFFTD